MRVATWNLKQAVAPRKPVPELLEWADTNIKADVYVFTEAKVPRDIDPRWRYQWNPEGIYYDKANKWGTVIATRSVEFREVTEARTRLKTRRLEFEWPAAVQVCDVLRSGERWATVVGLYAVTRDRQGSRRGRSGALGRAVAPRARRQGCRRVGQGPCSSGRRRWRVGHLRRRPLIHA